MARSALRVGYSLEVSEDYGQLIDAERKESVSGALMGGCHTRQRRAGYWKYFKHRLDACTTRTPKYRKYRKYQDLLTSQWRHDGRNGVSNQQPCDCLLNRLFRRRSKKTLTLRVAGLCAGNSPVSGEFPAQMASDAENVSISWRHHWTILN